MRPNTSDHFPQNSFSYSAHLRAFEADAPSDSIHSAPPCLPARHPSAMRLPGCGILFQHYVQCVHSFSLDTAKLNG